MKLHPEHRHPAKTKIHYKKYRRTTAATLLMQTRREVG
jgi:hypothetical protein